MSALTDARKEPDAAGRAAEAVPVPTSTYRLQLRPGFGFREAAGVLDYLQRLGVTDVYLSPLFRAAPGSEHGYDVADHNALSEALGGDEAHRAFTEALAARGMGQVIDVVPNHMGVGRAEANAWWWDVLENGECSPYARFFDIDWRPVKEELRDKVLLPVLGDQYGHVLERGELSLTREGGTIVLRYFDHSFPVNPRSIPGMLLPGLDASAAAAGEDSDHREFLSVLTALENLPTRLETDPVRVVERQREKEVARERMARVLERSAPLRRHVEERLRACNGAPGRPESFDALHRLLEMQAYRLAYWRTAFHEINYRRFFDVNGLASLRVEDPRVFDASHGLLWTRLLAGPRTGLRIDHLDGLFDPGAYLAQIAAGARRARGAGEGAGGGPPLYVVAEKIFSPGEDLPASWPLHGTTGYDFLADLNALFVDPAGLRALHAFYRRFTRREGAFEEVAYQSKKIVLESTLASELNLLAHDLNRISEGDRRSRDFTLNSLRDMLVEVIACFPVYRTYIDRNGPREEDRAIVLRAVSRARRRNPAMDGSIFDFLVAVLLDDAPEGLPEGERVPRREFAMKFQQYTGPVQAKGVEDTAFYRHGVLLSLNEVGGAPDRPTLAPAGFHDRNRARRARWPHGMLATSTHDTKRGEDVRARLNALSEMPEAWAREVAAWSRINGVNRSRIDGEYAPDRGDEYFFYQTLCGLWPLDAPDLDALVARLRDYMRKAIREAKLHTSWINENQGYERAVDDFVERVLRGRTAARFLERFLPFQRRVAIAGAANALAQVVLKSVSPGVPDTYQGTETWALTLVDPDNRRPVDFEARGAILRDVESALDPAREREARRGHAADLLRRWEDGGVKLLVTAAGARLRRAAPALFADGEYAPLAVGGERAAHAVACARLHGAEAVLAVVPRFSAALTPDAFPCGEAVWSDTEITLPEALAGLTFVDVLSGAAHRAAPRGGGARLGLGAILADLPVALLYGTIDGGGSAGA